MTPLDLNAGETAPSASPSRKHDIPLDHFDYKYVDSCNKVAELEKIYKVLV